MSSSARTVTSDDGLFTVDVPAGAVADSVALTATAKGQADLPPELRGLQVRSAFYALEPSATDFAAPVMVTRRVAMKSLGLTAADGWPVLVLAERTSGGEWEWLGSQLVVGEDNFVTVSGAATHAGLIFAFGGSTFATLDAPTGGAVNLGDSTSITAHIMFPDTLVDLPVLGVFEPIVEGAVEVGASDGPLNNAISQTFRCLFDGVSTVGISFAVINIEAESVLFHRFGLAPAATTVELTTPLTCGAGEAPTPSP